MWIRARFSPFFSSPAAFGSLLVTPAIAAIAILYVLPIIRLGFVSLEPQPSGSVYAALFHDFDYGRILVTTLRVSAQTTAVCLLLGYPLAYVLARSSVRTRGVLIMLVLLPSWTSILVRNYAWIYLLQYRGFINNFLTSMGLVDHPLALMFSEFGVVLGMSNVLLPYMVLPIYVSLQSQETSLLEAAASLGARPWHAFFKVTLPLSKVGIGAGVLIVFAASLGFYVTPALLGGGKVLVSATFIAREIEDMLNWPMASAASMILLGVVLVIVLFGGHLAARQRESGGSLV